MIQRFKNYLDKQFSPLPDSDAVLDFKEELLGNLMDKATECQDKGMSDDQIYDYCINTLGDYTDTLKQLNRSPIDKIKDAKFQKRNLYILAGILSVIIIYLGTSFITKAWDITWLIIVGAVLCLIIGLICVGLKNSLILHKKISARLWITILTVILITTLYLVLSFVIDGIWSKSWIIMVGLLAVITIENFYISKYIEMRKVSLIEQILAIMMVSVFAFLLLAVLGFGYTYTWLTVLIGVVFSLIVSARNIKTKE